MKQTLAEQNSYTNNYSEPIMINGWYVLLFLIVLSAVILLILKTKFKKYIRNRQYFHHTVFLVRLPKDRPGDENKEWTVQQLHEEIAQGETLFSAIGGLKAQRSFKSLIWGREDHFSMEIVANQKQIAFYLVCPQTHVRYLEQQVQAHYPDAVMEAVTDYNIFSRDSQIAAGYVKTKKHFALPIKTYAKMEFDPFNSIVNVLSKLSADESLAVQFLVRSAKGEWHSQVSGIVREALKLHSISEAMNTGLLSKISGFGKELFESAKPQDKNPLADNQKRLTAMEEEIIKGMEAKNAKAGLDVNIRIISAAKSKTQAVLYLDNLLSAMSQYNHYEYGNVLSTYKCGAALKNFVDDFIYRRFDPAISSLLNTEELASLFHLPLRETETPNILWLTARQAPAPNNVPDEGIYLGDNLYRGVKKEIKIKREDRRRHMHIMGKSGVGKSQFIANMAVQDVINGEGICLIDPHGDLVEDVLLRIPAERADDVIIFSPHDMERPMALNLIEYDARYPEQKTFVINELIGIFDKLYDLKATGGPIFEQYMRNALLLIMSDTESGSTLMEVPKVLSDPVFRKMKLERCADPTVVDFWRKEAEKAGGDAALANIVPYITSKLTTFISNDMMRPIIGQQTSSFNFRDIMDKQKILLVNLPKGVVGELNAHLLGMIIVGKILMSALSRTDMPQEDRKDFYLYIDEFQNFTTNSICQILSEARKYGLNLIIAHQYIGQMVKNNDPSIKDAVFGNVGSSVIFKVGSEDAEFLEKEFSPVFNKYDLVNIEAYTAYIKLLIGNTSSRPFSLHSPWPIAGTKDENIVSKLRSLSRLKYGRDRSIVEAEIRERTNLA